MKSPGCSIGISADISDISSNFYRTHGGRYAEINKLELQLIYVEASHAGLSKKPLVNEASKKIDVGALEALNLNLPKGDMQSSYKENGLKQIL